MSQGRHVVRRPRGPSLPVFAASHRRRPRRATERRHLGSLGGQLHGGRPGRLLGVEALAAALRAGRRPPCRKETTRRALSARTCPRDAAGTGRELESRPKTGGPLGTQSTSAALTDYQGGTAPAGSRLYVGIDAGRRQHAVASIALRSEERRVG